MNTNKKKISAQMSMYIKFLHQHGGLTGAEIRKKLPNLAARSVYRHLKKSVDDKYDRRHDNTGRPRIVGVRDERNILRAIQKLRAQEVQFTSKRVQEEANLGHVTTRTVRRYLNNNGYRYRQARKKGLVTKADRLKRVAFAREMLPVGVDFWKNKIGFYFDGVGFAHKGNPHGEARAAGSMTWRLPREGLQCSTKGKKEGSGGRMANFFVGISHDSGTILCEQMETKLTGASFADFVVTHFPTAFERVAKPECDTFLQDGDPRQNSKAAKDAMTEIGCQMFAIPPRSPDLNPIENIFQLVRRQLRKDALTLEIRQENYQQFCRRVKRTIENLPIDVINRTIESLPKRLALVISGNGMRTKY